MKYSFDIRNKSNGKVETIEGTDVNDLMHKVARRVLTIRYGLNYEINYKKSKSMIIEAKREIANTTTNQTIEERSKLVKILEDAFEKRIDIWSEIEEKLSPLFTKPAPEAIKFDEPPKLFTPSCEPNNQDLKYYVPKKMMDFIFKENYNQALENAHEMYLKDHLDWVEEKDLVEAKNKSLMIEYEEYKKEIESRNEKASLEWQEERELFYVKAQENKADHYKYQESYHNYNKNAIEYFAKSLLMREESLLKFYDKNVFVNYNASTKMLYVEYDFPNNSSIDRTKEIKYNSTKDLFSVLPMSDSEFGKFYDDIIYKLAIKVLYEIFYNDEIKAIDHISLNGYVNTIDQSIGSEIRVCILSLTVSATEFNKINITQIDSKACFKKLKGVSASSLSTLTAIAPIIYFDKEDHRFIESKNVFDGIDNKINLASMNWEDFEHLVREIFEKEFSVNGGEVKVTQASRDGGVDAIAFDPDVIRGGKIVIQAKRYTNTVGVSAVRDLYGTVMNEGAIKGILVTTSDYGSDAYEFIKDKPLTLLNGSNLLHLLEKHGKHAKIDIQEAKKLIKDEV